MALFNSSNRTDPMAKQAAQMGPGQINMIGEGTVLEGTLRAEGDVRISGRVVGKVHVDGKVIIAQEGYVEGELIAASADVAGTVKAEVTIQERLVLKNTAQIDGNIKTGRFVVEEGAVFAGNCEMTNALPDKLSGDRRKAGNGVAAS